MRIIKKKVATGPSMADSFANNCNINGENRMELYYFWIK